MSIHHARVLIVDDEIIVRTLIGETVRAMGHEVFLAASLAEGRAYLVDESQNAKPRMDVVFLDVHLPDGNGLDAIADFYGQSKAPEIIIITSHGTAEGAEMALRHGVWEYVQKPLKVHDVTATLGRALSYRAGKLASGERQLEHTGIIGTSPCLERAFDLLSQAAQSDVNVLIHGETGTGKELFARALHRNSPRAQGPFITLDCASMVDNLVESQLFGHKKGAFTGAERTYEGVLQQAHGGTLFLDELGDLPLTAQGSFLRALELRSFRPVGASKEVFSDFRLVAASNKELHDMVRLGLFRSDLLYRLRGMTLTLPPLRERQEDIAPLSEYMMQQYCKQNDGPLKKMAEDFVTTLQAYPWPGNVRELRHTVECACAAAGAETSLYARQLPVELRIYIARKAHEKANVEGQTRLSMVQESTTEGEYTHARLMSPVSGMTTGQAMTAEHGDDARVGAARITKLPDEAMPTLRAHKAEAERHYVAVLLAKTEGDMRKAAKIAGVSRGHFYELVKKHEL